MRKAFGLVVSEKKTDTMATPTRGAKAEEIQIDAACQTCTPRQKKTTSTFGAASPRYQMLAMSRSIHLAWLFFKKNGKATYNRPQVELELKERLPKAEVVETLLHRSVTWTLLQAQYDKRCTTHHQMLLRRHAWVAPRQEDEPGLRGFLHDGSRKNEK